MLLAARILTIGMILATLSTPALAQTTGLYAAHVDALVARENSMLRDVAAHDQREAASALPTIARVHVGPFRGEMTNRTEDFIDTTWGACRADTTMEALNAPAPNPINGHIAEAEIALPLETLFDTGNQVDATYANGVVERCGRP